MRAVIFGASQVGIDFYFEINEKEEVIAFIDNDVSKQGKEILGIKIFPADKLAELGFDIIYITSVFYRKQIEEQIKELGIPQNKISYCPIINSRTITDALSQFQTVIKRETYREEYENKWEKIRQKYECVSIYKLRVDTIGDCIARFFMIKNSCKQDNGLNVFIPDSGSRNIKRICNKYLVEMLNRELYLVQEDNVAFWTYVIEEHSEDLNIKNYYQYDTTNRYPAYKMETGDSGSHFTDAETETGKTFLKQIDLKKPFVCVAARTATYNEKTINTDLNYAYRNMNFGDYEAAVKCLQEYNIMAVRMGRMEEPMEQMENCIDYAGMYADDFNDFYLSSECEFMIANSSGIVYIAGFFARPVLMVNAVPVSFGYGGTVFTSNDLYIPKKYYDISKNRYLSLREMMKVESRCLTYGDRYEKMGIRFINNTPEEIAEAGREMVERLAGRWQDNEQEQVYQKQYQEIYQEMKKEAYNNPDNWIGETIPLGIATTYLKNNLYLLS